MRFSLLPFALSLSLAALPAFAGETPEAPAIRPVFQKDGAFGFCLGEQTYLDGRKVTIALSLQKQMNIGATIPGAGFKKGERYDVSVAAGDAPGRKVRGAALNEETLLMQMGANAAFQKSLLASRSLSVSAGTRKVAFTLPDMQVFIASLKACLAANDGKRQAAEPAAGKTFASSGAPDSSGEAFPAKLRDLLKTAGIPHVQPLSLDQTPADRRPADFVWKTGNVLGGVRERQAPEGKDLSDLIGLHLSGLEKKCAGTFKADVERETRVPGFTMRLAQATCAPKNKKGNAVFVAMLFYLTKDRGFAVFTHEGDELNRDEALRDRSLLASTLLAMARKQGDGQP